MKRYGKQTMIQSSIGRYGFLIVIILIALFIFFVWASAGSVERVVIHAIDTQADTAQQPISITDIIAQSRQVSNTKQSNTGMVWLLIALFIVTAVVVTMLVGAPFFKQANAFMKTAKKKSTSTPTQAAPLKPVRYLNEIIDGDFTRLPPLPPPTPAQSRYLLSDGQPSDTSSNEEASSWFE